MAEVNLYASHIDLLCSNINRIGESVDKIESTVSKENEELKEKLRVMEKELEEAKASSNHWEQKYTDLVHRSNQYESVLKDFDYTTEQIIDKFNDIVCGIRIPCSEGFIRKNYKEMNFTESGELPVYIYKSDILKHISSFISAIRSYSKDYIGVIQDPITINRADRKLSTRALKALRKYYSYFKI